MAGEMNELVDFPQVMNYSWFDGETWYRLESDIAGIEKMKEAIKIYQQLLRGEYELALKTLPRHEHMQPVFDEDLRKIKKILNLHVKPGITQEYTDAINNSKSSDQA